MKVVFLAVFSNKETCHEPVSHEEDHWDVWADQIMTLKKSSQASNKVEIFLSALNTKCVIISAE